MIKSSIETEKTPKFLELYGFLIAWCFGIIYFLCASSTFYYCNQLQVPIREYSIGLAFALICIIFFVIGIIIYIKKVPDDASKNEDYYNANFWVSIITIAPCSVILIIILFALIINSTNDDYVNNNMYF